MDINNIENSNSSNLDGSLTMTISNNYNNNNSKLKKNQFYIYKKLDGKSHKIRIKKK